MNKPVERKNYINGQWLGSDKTFTKLSPVDGSVVCQVHEASRDMVDQAVKGAKAALHGPWGKMPVAASTPAAGTSSSRRETPSRGRRVKMVA